jgi:hypothetical protein
VKAISRICRRINDHAQPLDQHIPLTRSHRLVFLLIV